MAQQASDVNEAEGQPEAPESQPAQGEAQEFVRPQRPARPAFRPDFRARSGGFSDRRAYGAGAPAGAPWARQPAGPPPSDLIGPDEELVAGRHPVEEAFIAHRKAIRLLVVPQRRQALEKLVLHATNLRIPIVEVEGGTLTSLAGFDGHQGIALVTDHRQFAGLDDILARAIERKEAPFVLVLDSLEDPQNFGSLLRTAEASGVHGVIYPVRRQAPLSAAAIKASAGAVEHLLLVPVEDLAEALTDLHVRGLRVIGSDADASLTARQADLRGPVVVVVGSEGQGLGPAVRRRCDTVVKIPMRGRVSSLNAAVAGSILLYEASSQRGGERPQFQNPFTEPESSSVAIGADEAEPEAGTAPAPEAAAPIQAGEPGAITSPEPQSAAGESEAAAVEPAPASKPRARRRTAIAEAVADPSADATIETEEDALLPGSAAIDSSDAASAE
jgi:23S rRNA (guanosine2251-2'-O)-methyltransferase